MEKKTICFENGVDKGAFTIDEPISKQNNIKTRGMQYICMHDYLVDASDKTLHTWVCKWNECMIIMVDVSV